MKMMSGDSTEDAKDARGCRTLLTNPDRKLGALLRTMHYAAGGVELTEKLAAAAARISVPKLE